MSVMWTGAIEYADGGPQPRDLGSFSRGILQGRANGRHKEGERHTADGRLAVFTCLNCGRSYPDDLSYHCPVCYWPPLPLRFRGQP